MIRRKRLCMVFLLIPGILFLSFYAENDQKTGIIIVNMEGFRNNRGIARISLFDKERGFPDKYKFAFAYGDSPIHDNIAQYIFHEVLYGEYSIGVFHDEDENRKIKTNFFGKPKEGVGVSNNVKISFGAPKFKDALFSVDRDTVEISIDVIYM